MNKNKGFTLVELLAVIAILAILVVITVPNILDMYKKSKQKAFVADTQIIFKAAESYIINEQLKNPNAIVTASFSGNASGSNLCTGTTELKGFTTSLKYNLVITNGKVTKLYVNNKEFILNVPATNGAIKLEYINYDDVTAYNNQNICN